MRSKISPSPSASRHASAWGLCTGGIFDTATCGYNISHAGTCPRVRWWWVGRGARYVLSDSPSHSFTHVESDIQQGRCDCCFRGCLAWNVSVICYGPLMGGAVLFLFHSLTRPQLLLSQRANTVQLVGYSIYGVDKQRRQLLCNSSTIYGVDKERRQLLAGAWCVRAARYCCCRHGSFAWVGGWVGGCAEWWVLQEGVPLPPWHGTLLQVDARALD